MLHANLTSLCFIEPELWPSTTCVAEIGIFYLFCSRDLDLDPMTFIYKLYSYSWNVTGCANMNLLRNAFESYRLIDRQTDRQKTDKQT